MRLRIGLVLLAGCAASEAAPTIVPPQSTTTGSAGFTPGETMTFEVALAGVVVGEAQLAVGELGAANGEPALVVRSRVESAGAAALLARVVDETTTTIAATTGKPLRVQTEIINGERRATTEVTFAGSTATIRSQRSSSPVELIKVDFKREPTHDLHSAMGLFRRWKPAVGDQRSIFIVGGRRMLRIDVRHTGTEVIGSAFGNRRALMFEGTALRVTRGLSLIANSPKRQFRVWLSDDDDRVPLRCVATTEYGEATVTLVEYFRP